MSQHLFLSALGFLVRSPDSDWPEIKVESHPKLVPVKRSRAGGAHAHYVCGLVEKVVIEKDTASFTQPARGSNSGVKAVVRTQNRGGLRQ
jgi:hypothetical protein